MFHSVVFRLASLTLLIAASAVFAQESEQEALQRMQQRIAARKAATTAPTPATPTPATRPAVATSLPASDAPLLKARAGFKTSLRPDAIKPQDDHGEKPDVPPAKVARLMHYKTPIGLMSGYITPDPHDGKKHPAVVWIHGGFGGLGVGLFNRNEPANNDQTPNAFIDEKFVVFVPSFRAHNDNPGKFEMFYGEVDDAVAGIDALAKMPYVDPARIYVVGHSTGGTMTLLVAEATNKIRAAFSLAGCPDVQEMVASESDHHNAPYDFNNPEEGRLRSAVNFVADLKTPLWFFDQQNSFYEHQAKLMMNKAAAAGAPFHAYIINPATHFDLVRPLTQLIATKLKEDTGTTCNVSLTTDDIATAFAKVFDGRAEQVEELTAPAAAPAIHVTDVAKKVFQLGCGQHQLDIAKAVMVVQSAGVQYSVALAAKAPAGDQVMADNGVNVTASDKILKDLGPFTISVAIEKGAAVLRLTKGLNAPADEPQMHVK